MSYSSEVLADSPLAWYRMGEASGTTLVDSSGNSRDGTYANITLGASSLIATDSDTAASYNGTSSKADITYASWMQTASFSIEAWILTSATGFRDIATRDNGTTQRSFEFRIDSTTGALNFIKLAGGTTNVVGVANIRDGVKHHVVATYDGSNIRLYVDGVLDKTTASTGSMAAGTAVLSLGMRRSDFWWSGTLDEVALYGSALSGARITAHYDAATTADATITVPVAAATASAPTPVVLTLVNVDVPVATAAASAATPAVVADSGVVVPAASASADALAPTIAASGNADVVVPVATATAGALAPVPSAGAVVDAPAASASAAGVAPTVAASSSATVVVPVASAAAAAVAPFVFNGSPDANVDIPVATATAEALAPSIGVGLTSDVSNVFNGRARSGFATVTVTVPVAATPAGSTRGSRVDKAVPLPLPTLVNGRPT